MPGCLFLDNEKPWKAISYDSYVVDIAFTLINDATL